MPSPRAHRLAYPVGIITRTGPGELTQTAMDALLVELLVERYKPTRLPLPADDPNVTFRRQQILLDAMEDRHLSAVRDAA